MRRISVAAVEILSVLICGGMLCVPLIEKEREIAAKVGVELETDGVVHDPFMRSEPIRRPSKENELLSSSSSSSSSALSSAPTTAPLTLLKGALLYSPDPLGAVSLLIGGNKVLGILPAGDTSYDNLPQVEVINVSGMMIIPGLVDGHCHVAGGGGELGPASRTPEAQLSELIISGLTTFVAIAGTDGVTRAPTNLLAKTRAMIADGLTGFMFTGNYRIPTLTLTDSVQNDIVWIPEIIGSKVAVSDARSSVPTPNELNKLVSDVRVAGLLSSKAGVVHVHVGSSSKMLDPLWGVVRDGDMPITQIIPTHVSSRGQALFDAAKEWLRSGGYIDLTADGEGEFDTINALLELKRDGLPLERVTMSSDAYGSFPKFDDNGNTIGYGVGKPDTLLKTVKTLVVTHRWSVQDAIRIVTANPATAMKLSGKGRITVGQDADILILDSQWNLQYVFAKGQKMKTPTWIKKGMFEP
eukprot:TRINITY_DN1632_c0_g1_i2.p1 TRINITY_DN1632_c0_g1~~TRINITY_DN1632_c0_g1_i2.p1  ORF type:complete len:469 (-),score=105.60 TRINITY_DN1632_c0_g1_i2:3099-4505(-)